MATTRCEPMGAGKRAAVAALYAGAAAIVAAGLGFGVYAWLNRVVFTAMGMDIPGVVFAAFAVFLGIRYFLSVRKLSGRLREASEGFRWQHFRPSHNSRKRRVQR